MISNIVKIERLEDGRICVYLHDDEPTRERVRKLIVNETVFRDFQQFRHAIEDTGMESVIAGGIQTCIDLKALRAAWYEYRRKM